jgi:two-component system sensor histidine kinase CpxA
VLIMPRLFWKLFLTLWLSIMGFAVLTAWVGEQIINQRVQQGAVDHEAERRDRHHRLRQVVMTGDEQRIRRVLRQMPRNEREPVFILDDNGREILNRDEAVQEFRQRGTPRLSTEPVEDRSGRQWVLVTRSGRPPRALLAPGPRGMALRLGLSALVSAFVSFFLARNLAAPLEHLRTASRRIATGDMGARVGSPLDKRGDEFGQLSRDFDRMAARLQEMQRANMRLLRDVSHELRSPLARLRVALEIARNRKAGDVINELDRIELESERLEALVDEVLDLLRESSEARPLSMDRFDLVELLKDLLDVVSYEVPEDAAEIRLVAPQPLMIEGDRELLWRAVENLLRNALIHSGDADVAVTAHRTEQGHGIELIVQDSGPGVPAAQLGKLFDAFYRVDESRHRGSGGHGLGLAIAATAVRRHGGKIEARNREEGGLEIRIFLPERDPAV